MGSRPAGSAALDACGSSRTEPPFVRRKRGGVRPTLALTRRSPGFATASWHVQAR